MIVIRSLRDPVGSPFAHLKRNIALPDCPIRMLVRVRVRVAAYELFQKGNRRPLRRWHPPATTDRLLEGAQGLS